VPAAPEPHRGAGFGAGVGIPAPRNGGAVVGGVRVGGPAPRNGGAVVAGAGAEAYVEGGPPGVTDVGGGVYVGGPAPKNGGAVVVGAGLLAPVPGGPPGVTDVVGGPIWVLGGPPKVPCKGRRVAPAALAMSSKEIGMGRREAAPPGAPRYCNGGLAVRGSYGSAEMVDLSKCG